MEAIRIARFTKTTHIDFPSNGYYIITAEEIDGVFKNDPFRQ